jgi:RNA polymerase sigma factor (sigma-70 family)
MATVDRQRPRSVDTPGVDSWDRLIESTYREHYLALVRLAVQLVDDQATAEDTVQEVFVALHRSGPVTGGLTDAKSYLRTAVVNRCRSVLRRRRTARAWLRPALRFAEPADAGLLRQDRHDRMLGAVSRLAVRQREVLVLRYYEELTVPEIAQLLQISPGAVSSSLNRGLKSLSSLVRSVDDE